MEHDCGRMIGEGNDDGGYDGRRGGEDYDCNPGGYNFPLRCVDFIIARFCVDPDDWRGGQSLLPPPPPPPPRPRPRPRPRPPRPRPRPRPRPLPPP
eukprot:749148-Hanusia_phi.AAC.2